MGDSSGVGGSGFGGFKSGRVAMVQREEIMSIWYRKEIAGDLGKKKTDLKSCLACGGIGRLLVAFGVKSNDRWVPQTEGKHVKICICW
ncbi:hypothetical protein BRADI_1g17098v3 [Brachypodium distachyon]|nr:hypothetical protein BRADI_1g17098v3 [Brachypodium distachyon]